ncbi:MAG: TetR family transcriptional regulator [Burkholderiales bacterium RIFCSPLOWO2_02_FULL_57_36]|nr:MAG: TetR family transcriptional regulator [Burkholderiales bacterium RIFCSPLOWO2_02_FULL_57_36]
MEQTISANPQTQRYVEMRETILDAAARLFNLQGFKGTTLSDVASRVGLSTNSITYYYRKKEDLAVACLLRSIETVDSIALKASEAAAPETRVREFVRLSFALLSDIASNRRADLMLFSDIRVLTEPHLGIIYEAYTAMFRRVRELLTEGDRKSHDRKILSARTHLLLSLMTWARTWTFRYEPDDYLQVANRVSDILIEGIAGPASQWTPFSDLGLRAPAMQDKADLTREAFLRAASILVNEQGYRGASVEKISALLNVTKGSFYHHNDNKEDLISECFERTFAVIRNMQKAATENPGSGWDRLCAVSRSLVRYQLSDQGPLLRVSAWSALPEALRHEKLRTMNQLAERFVGFLVEGMKDGSIRTQDQSLAALLISSMINASEGLERWVPEANVDNADELYVRPLFLGIFSAPS